jgi:hypothetical protein
MKYFEYGVVRLGGSEEYGHVFRRDTTTEDMRLIMSILSEKGNLGWEVYQVIDNPDGKTHFLMKREVSKEYAREMHFAKHSHDVESGNTNIQRQGFVDSTKPDSETWK